MGAQPFDPQVSMPLASTNSTSIVYGVGVSGLNLPNLSIPMLTSTFSFGGGSATNVNFGGGFLYGFYILSIFHLVLLISLGFPYSGVSLPLIHHIPNIHRCMGVVMYLLECSCDIRYLCFLVTCPSLIKLLVMM